MAIPANGYRIKKNGAPEPNQSQGSPFPVGTASYSPGHQSGVHQVKLNAGDVIKIARDTSSDPNIGIITNIVTVGLNENAATLTINKIAELP